MALNHPTVTSDRGMKNDENPITTNASGNTPWTDSDELVRSASAAQRPERRRQDEPQVGVRGEPRLLVADPAPAEITAMKNSGNAGAGVRFEHEDLASFQISVNREDEAGWAAVTATPPERDGSGKDPRHHKPLSQPITRLVIAGIPGRSAARARRTSAWMRPASRRAV